VSVLTSSQVTVTHIWELTAAHLNQIPGVLVVLGLAALPFGVLPRDILTGWIVVGYGIVAGTFGPMLDLPDTVYDLFPLEHPARMPLECFALLSVLLFAARAPIATTTT